MLINAETIEATWDKAVAQYVEHRNDKSRKDTEFIALNCFEALAEILSCRYGYEMIITAVWLAGRGEWHTVEPRAEANAAHDEGDA